MTSGLLSWIIYWQDHRKDGIFGEIIGALDRENALADCPEWWAFGTDVEKLKLLLEDLCVRAGVRLRLHTRVCATRTDKQRITHIVTESNTAEHGSAIR
jgi:hypothetical protein